MTESKHWEHLTDPDHEVRYLGILEGLSVNDERDGPMLFLHGNERSAVVRVDASEFADGLARAGVELEVLIGETDGTEDTEPDLEN